MLLCKVTVLKDNLFYNEMMHCREKEHVIVLKLYNLECLIRESSVSQQKFIPEEFNQFLGELSDVKK